MICCTQCSEPYPQDETPYCCLYCGGLFDFIEFPRFDPRQTGQSSGIWRYRHAFGLPDDAPTVYLGEGDTPLAVSSVRGRQVYFKLEFLNPTFSFKDRGTAVLVSFLSSRGVSEAMDDSSGNAGASFAAYAAAAGIRARVFVPEYASGPKRVQIGAYGAEVVPVSGPRSRSSQAVREAARQGGVYASHALLPHGLPGYATTAYELLDQLGETPEAVILPVGQGNLLLSMGRGFQGMKNADLIQKLPKLIGVQARACAPLWASFHQGKAALEDIQEGRTLAEGVRIRHPYRLESLLEIVRATKGDFIAVEESDIKEGHRALAKHGFYVEPTSAIVWAALQRIINDLADPIVVLLTGAGLKSFN